MFCNLKTLVGVSMLIDTIYSLHEDLEYTLTVCNGSLKIPPIKSYIARLKIGSNCGSQVSAFSLTLENYPRLISISIGSNSFKDLNALIIKNNARLKSVRVDSNCFLGRQLNLTSLKVYQCPKLEVISIGENSFMNASSVELNTLPSLIFFEFNETSFVKTKFFSLYQLDRFELLVVPQCCMKQIETIQLISLPALRKIVLGKDSWIGTNSNSELICQSSIVLCLLSRLSKPRNF